MIEAIQNNNMMFRSQMITTQMIVAVKNAEPGLSPVNLERPKFHPVTTLLAVLMTVFGIYNAHFAAASKCYRHARHLCANIRYV